MKTLPGSSDQSLGELTLTMALRQHCEDIRTKTKEETAMKTSKQVRKKQPKTTLLNKKKRDGWRIVFIYIPYF